MKVLFISPWYPNRYDNMAGLFVRKHAEAASLYCDVNVLYVHADSEINTFEIIRNKQQNITEYFVYFPAPQKGFFQKIIKMLNYVRAYQKGFKLLFSEQGKPDVIQANVFTRTALVAYWMKIKHKIPYTVIEHWTRYFREKPFQNQIHKKLSILTAKKAGAILPVTNHLRKSMESHGMTNNNYHIINNVVDKPFFEKSEETPNDKIVFTNITCFNDDQKNLSGILNVLKRLTEVNTNFKVYLVGGGVDFELIKTKAKELGLENKYVFFTGVLTGSELVEYFKKSDFTFLFSNYENIPVVISESLVCGKPVISTDVGGINEHIDKSNGILIEKEDEDALYESIIYMMEHYQEYDSEEIKMKAEKLYSYERVGKELFNIYKSIV
ncbi:MAG: glycosyltransferase family 4 protein [Porphyromonadaceae bacterium]|nr:glycosyltransferase family 4 protein [Porphyromonadaceae bacterium]